MASNIGRWWLRFVREAQPVGNDYDAQTNEDGGVPTKVPTKVNTGPKSELYFLKDRTVETYSEDILYYDQHRACPKCGTLGANTEYKPAVEFSNRDLLVKSNLRRHYNWAYPYYDCVSGPEPAYDYGYCVAVYVAKMYRSCNNCKHSWNEKPLDVS